MIVKLKSGSGWQMFDNLEDVNYRYLGDEVIGVRGDVRDFTGTVPNSEGNCALALKENRVELWAHQKGRSPLDALQIITYVPVYLLNDEGKTIEVI